MSCWFKSALKMLIFFAVASAVGSDFYSVPSVPALMQ